MKKENGKKILKTAIDIQRRMGRKCRELGIYELLMEGTVELAKEVVEGKIDMKSAGEIAQTAVEISHAASYEMEECMSRNDIKERTVSLLRSPETFRIAEEIWVHEQRKKLDFDTPIQGIGDLSVRVRKVLSGYYSFREVEIKTIGELVRKNKNELLMKKNFGKICLKEVIEYLKRFDLRLGMTETDINKYLNS